MTAVFLQVRLDSSRLPEKALLTLADRSVIEHAMAALKQVPADVHVLLTTEDSRDALQSRAEKNGFGLFAGPKDDVLRRFDLAAREVGADTVVRATGDNPLVSSAMARRALSLRSETGAVYAGYLGLPYGTGVEVVEVAALHEAAEKAEEVYEREHVTPYLYRRPEMYRLALPEAPPEFHYPEARVTLDTPEDYRFLETVYAEIYRGVPIDLHTLVPWLRNREKQAG